MFGQKGTKNKEEPFKVLFLGLSRFIRVPDPPKEPTRSDPKLADPTTPTGRRRVFITKNRFRQVGFRFSSLKTRKSWTNRKISRFRAKFSRNWWKNPNPGDIFPDSGAISLRFDEILTGSGKISSNSVRFSSDLCFFHRFLAVLNPTDPPATRWCSEPPNPITPTGQRRVPFFPPNSGESVPS